MTDPLLALANAALKHRRADEELEVDPLALSATGRLKGARHLPDADALDLAWAQEVVITRRRHLLSLLLNRACHALGWHSRGQQVAANTFITAVHAHTDNPSLAERILAEEGVRRNRAVTARQVLRVAYRLEPEKVLRLQFSRLAQDEPSAPRKWHYASLVVLRLKAFLQS